MKQRNDANRKEGKRFEQALKASADKQGVLAVRNGQQIRHLPGGQMIAVKSHLDWTLVLGDKVVFVDNKSFAGEAFTFGQINAHQLQLASEFEQRGILAGFVVLFRALNKVSFFGGRYILHRGKRSRFVPQDGLPIGQASHIDLLALANCKPVNAALSPAQPQMPAPQAAMPGG